MDNQSLLLAKAAALKKSFEQIDYQRGRCLSQHVEHLFPRYKTIIAELKSLKPLMYSDVPDLDMPESIGTSPNGAIYEETDIKPLINNLDYVLELHANVRIGERLVEKEKPRKIFISHGSSKEWYKVQTFLEKDMNIPTLELAQEPNLGRTVLQKLYEESEKCSVAVIVMTGDDIITVSETRARENVMHEIGFFQGKYGLGNVILLHENGVNIPSNIHGLVYIGFPKETVEATLGAITRELKVLLA